jgi:hypothetical protein
VRCWVTGRYICIVHHHIVHKKQRITFVVLIVQTHIIGTKNMPRRGEMSEQDVADELVRHNASYYNVVLHAAQQNSRIHFSSPDLGDAIEFAENVYQDINQVACRCAMVYAVDEHDHFALMGTTNKYQYKFKPNVVKIY